MMLGRQGFEKIDREDKKRGEKGKPIYETFLENIKKRKRIEAIFAVFCSIDQFEIKCQREMIKWTNEIVKNWEWEKRPKRQ